MPSTVLAVLALLMSMAALVLATIANRRWARRPRPAAGPEPTTAPPPGLAGLERSLTSVRDDLDGLRAAVDAVRAAVDRARAAVDHGDATALRHVAVVRYDAFADVGGRLSHSVALLDDTRCGLVLTTLSGKSDVRTYVRTISAGVAEGTLTAEEQQAIDAAVAGAPGSQP